MNKKGFTLVELLAVIVILGIIIGFAYPNVIILIEKNKNDNYEQLKKSVVSAAKSYVSDYRYEISVNTDKEPAVIEYINGIKIIDNQIPVLYLVDDGKLTLDKDGHIKDPRNKEMCLVFKDSYVVVNFDTTKKDYVFKDIVDGDPLTGKLEFTNKCE